MLIQAALLLTGLAFVLDLVIYNRLNLVTLVAVACLVTYYIEHIAH